MKKLIHNLTATIILSLAVIMLNLTGCNSSINTNEEKQQQPLQQKQDNYVLISIKNNELFASRSASVLKPDNVIYSIIAYKVDGNNNRIEESKVSESIPVVGVDLTYKLDLSSGNWVFEAKGYKENDTQYEKPILYGNTFTNPITCTGGRYQAYIDVFFMKNATSSVNLTIDVSKVVSIDKLKISNTGTDLDDVYPCENGKIIINKNNLPSGTYDAKLYFYSGSVILYSTTEKLNLRDNLTVENWIYSGPIVYDADNKIDKSKLNGYLVPREPMESNPSKIADFILTPELIIQQKNNYCYVGTITDVADKAIFSPSDENTGAINSPYKTLQAAFDRTMALNKEFKNAGKQQRDFTIIISEDIDTSETKQASITTEEGNSFNLVIKQYKEDKPKLTGNITIGQHIPTTISSISMDGLISKSKLTLNNCILSGKAPFEITNVSDESVITNTSIGTETTNNNITTITSNKIDFTGSNVTISNTNKQNLLATDFTADNSILNINCTTSNRFKIEADTFKLINSHGTSDKSISINNININTTDFILEQDNYLTLKNLNFSVTRFNTTNLLNTKLESSSITSTFSTTLNDSQIDFTNTTLDGTLNINGTATETNNQRKVTFSGSGTVISGTGLTVNNSTVEFTDSSSITSTGTITFENKSNIKLNNSAKIYTPNTYTSLDIINCTTEIDNASINIEQITTGDSTANSPTKTDNITINESTITTDKEGQLTFNSSNVIITKSTINGPIFVSNDNLTLKDTTLNGDIGKAADDNSSADGIDTASTVILAGTTVLPPYASGGKPKDRIIYVEDEAILYTKNLPAKADSPETIATLSALYPTKDEVILVNLDNDDKPTNFDSSFIVSGAASSTPIDERFKLDSAGYYLDYRVPAGDTVRKGVIKESSVGLILPETGGFTLEIAENDNISEDSNGHIVINKDNLAQAPIKVIIKDRAGKVVNTQITYQLYREATPIGDSVTIAASSEGITISGERIEQELQFASKVTYFLKITFTDNDAKLLYSDLYVVDIVRN